MNPGTIYICLSLKPTAFALYPLPFTNPKPGLELENIPFKETLSNSPTPITHIHLSTFPPNKYSDTPTLTFTYTKLQTSVVGPFSESANDMEAVTSHDSLLPTLQRTQMIPKAFLINQSQLSIIFITFIYNSQFLFWNTTRFTFPHVSPLNPGNMLQYPPKHSK